MNEREDLYQCEEDMDIEFYDDQCRYDYLEEMGYTDDE